MGGGVLFLQNPFATRELGMLSDIIKEGVTKEDYAKFASVYLSLPEIGAFGKRRYVFLFFDIARRIRGVLSSMGMGSLCEGYATEGLY
jgi:hypothetical protein